MIKHDHFLLLLLRRLLGRRGLLLLLIRRGVGTAVLVVKVDDNLGVLLHTDFRGGVSPMVIGCGVLG